MITVGAEGERFARPFAKIGAEKSPHPGASAFRHRDDNCVATGKLARAAAEVPSAKTATPARIRRFARNASDFAQQLGVTLGEAFQRIAFLDQLAPAQSESSSLLRVLDQTAERFDPIILRSRKETIFAVRNDFIVHANIGRDDRRPHSHVLQNFVTAFSPCPNRVPQRHNSDVEAREIGLFRLQPPWIVLDVHSVELKRFVGHDLQF